MKHRHLRALGCPPLPPSLLGRRRWARPPWPMSAARAPPPLPPSRTKWTRLVHPSVLIGHASSTCLSGSGSWPWRWRNGRPRRLRGARPRSARCCARACARRWCEPLYNLGPARICYARARSGLRPRSPSGSGPGGGVCADAHGAHRACITRPRHAPRARARARQHRLGISHHCSAQTLARPPAAPPGSCSRREDAFRQSSPPSAASRRFKPEGGIFGWSLRGWGQGGSGAGGGFPALQPQSGTHVPTVRATASQPRHASCTNVRALIPACRRYPCKCSHQGGRKPWMSRRVRRTGITRRQGRPRGRSHLRMRRGQQWMLGRSRRSSSTRCPSCTPGGTRASGATSGATARRSASSRAPARSRRRCSRPSLQRRRRACNAWRCPFRRCPTSTRSTSEPR